MIHLHCPRIKQREGIQGSMSQRCRRGQARQDNQDCQGHQPRVSHDERSEEYAKRVAYTGARRVEHKQPLER